MQHRDRSGSHTIRTLLAALTIAVASIGAVPTAGADPPYPCHRVESPLGDCLDLTETTYQDDVEEAKERNREEVAECNSLIDGSAEPQELDSCLDDVRDQFDSDMSAAEQRRSQGQVDCLNYYPCPEDEDVWCPPMHP